MSAHIQEDNVLSHAIEAARDVAASRAPMMAAHPDDNSKDLLERILTSLDDDKAEDVIPIDLRGRSDMADYMVICSGRSTRQVSAIAEKLADQLKRDAGVACKIEGKETGDWVLIDAGDVIVHVFRPEVREFYQLEKMWQTPSTQATTV
jgi:ribosome-associated protein